MILLLMEGRRIRFPVLLDRDSLKEQYMHYVGHPYGIWDRFFLYVQGLKPPGYPFSHPYGIYSAFKGP